MSGCYVSAQIAQHADDLGAKDARDEAVFQLGCSKYDEMKSDTDWIIEAMGEAISHIDLGTTPGNSETSFAKRLDQFIGHHDRALMAEQMFSAPQQFGLDLRALAQDYLWSRAMELADDEVPNEPISRRERMALAKLEDLP